MKTLYLKLKKIIDNFKRLLVIKDKQLDYRINRLYRLSKMNSNCLHTNSKLNK